MSRLLQPPSPGCRLHTLKLGWFLRRVQRLSYALLSPRMRWLQGWTLRSLATTQHPVSTSLAPPEDPDVGATRTGPSSPVFCSTPQGLQVVLDRGGAPWPKERSSSERGLPTASRNALQPLHLSAEGDCSSPRRHLCSASSPASSSHHQVASGLLHNSSTRRPGRSSIHHGEKSLQAAA